MISWQNCPWKSPPIRACAVNIENEPLDKLYGGAFSFADWEPQGSKGNLASWLPKESSRASKKRLQQPSVGVAHCGSNESSHGSYERLGRAIGPVISDRILNLFFGVIA